MSAIPRDGSSKYKQEMCPRGHVGEQRTPRVRRLGPRPNQIKSNPFSAAVTDQSELATAWS
jgi:hypothetical protein